MIVFIIPKNSGLKSKAEEILKTLNLIGNIIEIRGEDIPCFVSKLFKEGKEVIGITGEDLFQEFISSNYDSKLEIMKRIKWEDDSYLFKKPCLCLLGPKNKVLEDFDKKIKVAVNSKYKQLAKKGILNRLEGKGYVFEKIYVNGASEEFFVRGIADLVIDIVCSGKSAEEAGLRVYEKIFESDMVIIGGKTYSKKMINFDYSKLDFKKMNGLIPTIFQDENNRVLVLAYSNENSIEKTITEGKPYFFSRKRNRVCLKGETSGNTQELIEIKTDCDKDALIFVVKQKGNACHLNQYSCFEEKKIFSLMDLYNKICNRIKDNDEKSYTKKLIANPNELKRKLIEEAGEVITADSRENLIWECADLIYFLFVIMAKEGITIQDIEKENQRRDKEKEILENPTLIFDMDGVLVDVTNSYRTAIKKTVEFFTNSEVSYGEIQSYKDQVGFNNDWDLTEAIIISKGKKIEKNKIIDKFQEYYLGNNFNGLIKNERWLFNKNILKNISKKYKLGIVTGRPKAEAVYTLKKNQVEGFFQVLISMDDVKKDKPNPEGINKAIKLFGTKNAIYFGDTKNDEIAASNANIKFKLIKNNINKIVQRYLK